MVVKAHTSIIGDTGYNCHAQNFFKELNKFQQVQIRNFTVGSSWVGYNNDEPHNDEYYIDEELKKMLVEQTLNSPSDREEFPLYTKYKNEGTPNVHIVLETQNHYYFYDNYEGKKIAYNVWETTRQPDDFFERLKTFDQIWVPSEWQRECTIQQGMNPNKIKVVPEGVDPETYKPINNSIEKPINRPFRFLLVGRWDYRKATREIIESFVKTFSENENVELLINVDNPFATDGLKSTEERLKKFGISHTGIKVLHHLSKEEYIKLLKSADVFLSCARGEGWNLPLIEAMSCGIPSIYSNWGGQLEFAKGRGIAVNITGEISAAVDNNESWPKDAPGNFAEPDFVDLCFKMRNVFENYSSYKKDALCDSEEVRKIYSWKNAAKKANQIIEDLINPINESYEDSVAVVLAHPNTPERITMLKKCLESIPIQKILSTNHSIPPEIQEMCDWVVYSKENPILDHSEFEKYGVDFFHWWIEPDGTKNIEPYKCEHGYAAYCLTREGIGFAKSLGKKKIHIINYDYTFSQEILSYHEDILKTNDLVFYTHNDWEFDNNNSYCSAFASGKTDVLSEFFFKYKTKDEYYSSLKPFNILEIQLYNHYINSNYKKCILNIEELKDKIDVNKECAYQHLNSLVPSELFGKSFKDISDAVNCDKSTYHRYDEIYPTYIDKWRDLPINIFEIGIEDGKSLEIWKNYFRYAKIWGMDISRKYSGDRYEVFIGDQSKIEDLVKISSLIPKCELIIDDGSHIPEHQLKTFNYLFKEVLNPGGVYIIEDIECSYWMPETFIYGYQTGHLNIIDYFSKLNHDVNSHYSMGENEMDIKSITFGPNCIIITKNEENKHKNIQYRFNDMIQKNSKDEKENEIEINFVDGPFVEIKGNIKKNYTIFFTDDDTDKIIYECQIKNNQWARCSRKWFTNWKIKIKPEGEEVRTYQIDLREKNVLISFDSSSLGDTIAWIPYVEEFRKKHNCKITVSTFLNELFENEYPNLVFVEPGTEVNNFYASYNLGVYFENDLIDFNKNKVSYTDIPLQAVASEILGLEYKEIIPNIMKPQPSTFEKPYICIANHSTAQSKYWNNPNGWQELVDYVKKLGYDVYLLSKEEDGYMGNKNPTGVIKVNGKSLKEIGSILLGSRGFIGLGSGLSWYSWALGVPTILISGFSKTYQEMSSSIYRIINEDVCHGCFARHIFDRGDWNWCPEHKGTERQFECTRAIGFNMIKPSIDEMLKK